MSVFVLEPHGISSASGLRVGDPVWVLHFVGPCSRPEGDHIVWPGLWHCLVCGLISEEGRDRRRSSTTTKGNRTYIDGAPVIHAPKRIRPPGLNKLCRRLLAAGAPSVCAYCRTDLSPEQRTVDHLVPVARGGIDDLWNLVFACARCNNEKADRTPSEWGKFPAADLFPFARAA